MLNRSLCSALMALLLCLVLAPKATASPILVYSNDFESGPGSIGPEWSGAIWHAAHSIPEVSAHLGDYFLSNSTTLTLTGLPAHSVVSLAFDLYLFQTWDGNNLTFGPDFFSLLGDVNFSATFTNHQPEGQTYPGVADVNPGLPGFNVTQVYYGLDPTGSGDAFLLNHSAGTFSVTFTGPTSQADEQWGIDNIQVTVDTPAVPEPSMLMLVGVGLLSVLRRQRQAPARRVRLATTT